MTRRTGVVAALAAICAVMAGRTRSEEDKAVSGFVYNPNSITLPKGALTFNLGQFTKFEFYVGTEKVVLTPAEMMAALKDR